MVPSASDSRLVLLPAVDVAGGQAVQLVQGRAGSERQFGDPRAAAERWQDGGAEWIHLVDLDAAFGRGDNAEMVTEVNSDGMLSGPNTDLLRRVCAATDRPVVASGGISTLADVLTLAEMVPLGVEGAIIGTALYVGNFTLEEALRAAATPSTESTQA